MATFREIVYSILDILKEHSDDAYYTEEHILFLAGNMRNFLLERKYKASRSSTFTEMSEENKQQICVPLEPATMLSNGCGSGWLRSTVEIPALSSVAAGTAFTVNDLMFTNVCLIAPERMPYVGYNKWLRNIIYAARSNDGHLYLKGFDPQFLLLDKVGMNAVFDKPEDAAKLAPEFCDTENSCDILDQNFPLEAALVPSCIEMVVQELIGSRFAPEDKHNNAKDDFSDAAVTNAKAQQPAERQYRREEGQ